MDSEHKRDRTGIVKAKSISNNKPFSFRETKILKNTKNLLMNKKVMKNKENVMLLVFQHWRQLAQGGSSNILL